MHILLLCHLVVVSQGLEHKPEGSQKFLHYDKDLQVPEGTRS